MIFNGVFDIFGQTELNFNFEISNVKRISGYEHKNNTKDDRIREEVSGLYGDGEPIASFDYEKIGYSNYS